MNQCSRNRRRHAAVPFGQLAERRNGRRIAQHDGYLTATRNASSLALGAGLGLGHDSGAHIAEHARFIRRDGHAVRRCVASLLEESAVQIDVHETVYLRKGYAASGHDFIKHSAPMTDWRKNAGRLHGGDFGGRVAVHGLLRSGAIPPMCESYIVTSDVSTGISA